MANYPNRDGRLANGVGLDTPQSVMQTILALADAGYDVEDAPSNGAALVDDLRAGPTNEGWQGRVCDAIMPMEAYQAHFSSLPAALRDEVTARWGMPESDPMHDGAGFRLPLRRYGKVIVAVQPARGYNIDPKATYHSPDLLPPHNYFALYWWLRAIAPTPWCISANMATWNGSRAKPCRCLHPAFPRRFWGRCRISILSSSMTRGEAQAKRHGGGDPDHLTPP